MFLNISELKKLLKSAYKGSGLIVGNLEDGLVMMNASGTWGVQVEEAFVPNKLKAALIELIGDLPEPNEAYNYQPDSMQLEVNLGRFDFREKWKQAKDYAVKTPFILRSERNEFALMQVHSSMELRPIPRVFIDMISAKDLDHKNESLPGRPSYSGGVLYWKNDVMIYWSGTSQLNEDLEEKVLPNLAFLDCFEQRITLRDGRGLPFGYEEE